ncbi:MAG: MFS transporter [Pseudomonadota bacterium]|nr:MFS transporter [Pseudomonadota bacterium]
MTTAVEPRTNSPTTRRRALIASLIGSSIEWFDFFLYGTAAALVFNKLFFPSSDPVVALLLSYLSFSLTFFIRPFGGFFFAHIGDRIGRKKTLVMTLALMGGATVAIGLLPTYQQIGVAAPILLVLLRIIQGLGIGGEWGGALLLAYEYAPRTRKGLFGSVPQVGVTVGMLLATLFLSLMAKLPEAEFLAWGWRVPFVASIVLVILGLWIRRGIDETPAFLKAKETGNIAKQPLVETVRHHWRESLIACGLKVVETAPFYIFSTFVVSYATNQLQYTKVDVLNAVSLAALVACVMIPVMGWLSDIIGRRRTYTAGVLLMAAFIVPYFKLLDTHSVTLLTLATVLAMGVIWAPITATLGTLCSEIFHTRVRYTGITLGYQIGAALAGGTAPLIATWLIAKYNGNWMPIAIYILILAAISLVAVLSVRNRIANVAAADLEIT